jgi:NAD(P)-dependent dehydrogenase (short-subunit alcohol dehydrogenase family)
MNEEGGQQTVHIITEQGREAIFVKTDVSTAVEVQALISKAVETYGRLDCAHNNAGISGFGVAGDAYTLTAEYPEERWHQVIAVNLTGVWLCMKYELQQMRTLGRHYLYPGPHTEATAFPHSFLSMLSLHSQASHGSST